MTIYKAVYNFWFEEAHPRQWYQKDSNFDQLIRQRFGEVHNKARNEELHEWRETPKGSLSEIIVLDQFSRNIYRDQAEAFACDELALQCSRTAIAKGYNDQLKGSEKNFLYMPFMHSESKEVHQEAMKYFSEPGMALEYELKHKEIIDRFGRYPHRNKILGRESTPEEIEFLKGPGSSF